MSLDVGEILFYSMTSCIQQGLLVLGRELISLRKESVLLQFVNANQVHVTYTHFEHLTVEKNEMLEE